MQCRRQAVRGKVHGLRVSAAIGAASWALPLDLLRPGSVVWAASEGGIHRSRADLEAGGAFPGAGGCGQHGLVAQAWEGGQVPRGEGRRDGRSERQGSIAQGHGSSQGLPLLLGSDSVHLQVEVRKHWGREGDRASTHEVQARSSLLLPS